jgi:hypothetical protein
MVDVRSVVRMTDQGRPYERDRIRPRELADLRLLGFLALAAETFRHGEEVDADR